MQVKLPAESEDQLKRPAYIRMNDAGVPICDNRHVPAKFQSADPRSRGLYRLQYLVAKGAILRKG